MKLEEIQAAWERDSQLDRTELGEESLRIPQLHSKYYKMYSAERLLMRKLEGEFKQFYKDKMEYYCGTIDDQTLDHYGWEPNPLKILRTDLSIYLEGDKELCEAALKVDYQKEKVDFIESIIKSLPNRGFQIKSAIEWEKFKMGA
jgi:Recombination, repair and ssDNA binding protein UvsY